MEKPAVFPLRLFHSLVPIKLSKIELDMISEKEKATEGEKNSEMKKQGEREMIPSTASSQSQPRPNRILSPDMDCISILQHTAQAC